MSCNGCRVLRKGCSETCILRPSLHWIETAEAQGHATLFVVKFFGRAALISFISAVPPIQRPALFQSLLFEAAGRTVNPVNGAVGLLSSGNWHVCQAAVETVLRGGALKPIPELLLGGGGGPPPELDDASECTDVFGIQEVRKRRRFVDAPPAKADLDLSLTAGKKSNPLAVEKRRSWSPSMNSEESLTTSCGDEQEIKLLNLFD